MMSKLLICLAFIAATVFGYEGACGSTQWTIPSGSSYVAYVYPNNGVEGVFDCDICTNSHWSGSNLNDVVFQTGVTGIGDFVFQKCRWTGNITIPATLVDIGENAFGGSNTMRYITVDSNNPAFTSENNVLYNKDKTRLIYHPALSENPVEIPSTVTSIGSFAFANSSYVNITIPSSVTSIGQGAFADCNKLKNIFIEGNNFKFEDNFLTSKDGKILYAYPLLDSVSGALKIPDSVETIMGYTFYNNNKITSVDLNNVESVGPYAFFNNYKIDGEVKIPDSVTYLGPWAFAKCTRVTSVKIGDGLALIENYTFFGDTYLASAELGSSIVSVAPLAFESCPAMTYEQYDNGLYLGPNSNKHLILYKAKDSTITSCKVHDDTKTIAAGSFRGISTLESLTISDSVKVIEDFAFLNTGLSSLTLGSGLVNISQFAFHGLKLTGKTLTIPKSVRYIGYSAFYCSSCQVTTLEIGENVEYIGNFAFAYFTKVTELEIPDSVKYVGNGAFHSYAELETLKIGKKVETLGYPVCQGDVSLKTIKVDSDNTHFKAVDNVLYTKDGKTLIVCPAKKTSVNIEKTVTALARYSFYNSDQIKKLTLPKSVADIGDQAFYWASELEAFNVEDGNSAFKSKSGLLLTSNGTVLLMVPQAKKKVKVPDSVTTISERAFERSQATSVYVGDNVDTIGQWTFNLMDNLKEASIGSGVTTWGTNVFSSCKVLTKLCYFGKKDPMIKVFNGITSLTSVTVPTDYANNNFCNKATVKAETCTVDAEELSESESDSDESYDSDISDSSKPSVAHMAIPSYVLIAIAACIASAMLFLF